jgi:hypothetical protein
VITLGISMKVKLGKTGKPFSGFLCSLEARGGVSASSRNHAGGNIAEPE